MWISYIPCVITRPLLAALLVAPCVFASSGGGTVEFAFIRNFVPARDAGFCNVWVPGGHGHIRARVQSGGPCPRQRSGRGGGGAPPHRHDQVRPGFRRLARIRRCRGGSPRQSDSFPRSRASMATAIRRDRCTIHPRHPFSSDSVNLWENACPGASGRASSGKISTSTNRRHGASPSTSAPSCSRGSKRFLWWAQMEDLGTKLSGHTDAEREFGPLPLAFAGGLRYTTGVRGLNLFTEGAQAHGKRRQPPLRF